MLDTVHGGGLSGGGPHPNGWESVGGSQARTYNTPITTIGPMSILASFDAALKLDVNISNISSIHTAMIGSL